MEVDHREHVKKALEEAIPFVDRTGYCGIAHIMRDALSLLKEQEAETERIGRLVNGFRQIKGWCG